MTQFIMLVGLPASGKSSYAKRFFDYRVIESDAYRKKNYGDEKVQGDNTKLFEEIHKDILKYLESGKGVVLDATNLTYKNRKSLLDKIPNGVAKACILFATQYKICLERNSTRERKVPEHVMERMYKSFEVPLYSEGWDLIEVLYTYDKEDYDIGNYIDYANRFEQDNPHHSMTLGQHSRLVAAGLGAVDENIRLAGLLHDCGKPFTKTFKNMKGESSDVAHYYNHQNVGAYETLFYLEDKFISDKEILFAAGLVNYHMRMYNLPSEKAINKLKETVGEDMFYFLEMLNSADKEAH